MVRVLRDALRFAFCLCRMSCSIAARFARALYSSQQLLLAAAWRCAGIAAIDSPLRRRAAIVH